MDPKYLILGRRNGQRIVLGNPPDQVVITIQNLRGDGVDLKFQAPGNVPIDRWEVAVQKGLVSSD